MSEKDEANLLALLDSANKVLVFTENIADAFYNDVKTFNAVLMNFVVIGESVAKLSEEVRNAHPHVPWTTIKRFRNIIAHNYFGVDAEEVWQIIHHQIPDLIQEVAFIANKP